MNNTLTHFIRDIYTCIKNSQYIIRFYDGNGGKSNQDILVTGTECETYLCACQWSGLSARWARRSCQIPRRAAGGPSSSRLRGICPMNSLMASWSFMGMVAQLAGLCVWLIPFMSPFVLAAPPCTAASTCPFVKVAMFTARTFSCYAFQSV